MARISKKFELSPRLKLGVGRSHSPNRIIKIATIVCLVLTVVLAGNAVRLILKNHASDNSSPQVLGVSDTKQAPRDTAQFTEYKVKKGDTLFNVSQQFHMDWMTLATLNNLKSPFSLKPGQILNIPKQ